MAQNVQFNYNFLNATNTYYQRLLTRQRLNYEAQGRG